ACTLSLALAAMSFAGSTVTYRTTAVTGQPAPGTEPGISFWVFTTPLNHDLMRPAIDNAGHVAFTARVTGPGVNESNRNGIWVENGTELVLAVRSGTQAPGTPDGVLFHGFPTDYIPLPPSIGGGRVGFVAELAGPGIDFSNGSGVWKQQDGQL